MFLIRLVNFDMGLIGWIFCNFFVFKCSIDGWAGVWVARLKIHFSNDNICMGFFAEEIARLRMLWFNFYIRRYILSNYMVGSSILYDLYIVIVKSYSF